MTRRCALLLCIMIASLRVQADTDLTSLSIEQLLDQKIMGASKYAQKQSEIAAAVSVISREEIRAHGWHTLDEALASLPGLYRTYDRQYGYLGTRGFSIPGDFNTRVLLVIDGNRVNDVVFDQAYIGREFPLDLSLIERIEFIPGPGGAVYGQNAMFGVINIVTRQGGSFHGVEASAAYEHPFARHEERLSWGGDFQNGADLVLSVSQMHALGADRFYDYGASGIRGIAAGLDGEKDAELFARLSRGAWSLEVVSGNRRKDDPTGVYLSDPLVPGTFQRDRLTLTQLAYSSPSDAQYQWMARVFANRERYDSPETFDRESVVQRAASDWAGMELRMLSTAWRNQKWLFGLEYQANLHQDQSFDNLTATPGLLDVDIPLHGWRLGAYSQDEWALRKDLSATIGLRVDHNNVTGTSTSPRLGLIWRQSDSTSWKALYGRAHRAPNVFERDYQDDIFQVANPALRGETIDTLEVVADRRVSPSLAVKASVYSWSMTGLVTQGVDSRSGLSQYQNGSDVHALGAEVSAERTFTGGARGRASVGYESAEYSNGEMLRNSPRLLGKLNFTTALPVAGLSLAGEVQYSSSRRTLDGSDLGGYTLSNLLVHARGWAPRLEFSLGAYNLFGVRYAQPGSHNNWENALEQDGRSVRFEARYQL